MNEILLYVALGLGGLLLCLIIPGMKTIAEAILKIFIDLITELFKHKGAFLVWFVKTIVADHVRILRHATTSRDDLDPTQKIRLEAEGYDI